MHLRYFVTFNLFSIYIAQTFLLIPPNIILSLLSLSNIDFSYNSNQNSNFSLDKISIEIEKGDFLSILGPNGSGKSTLIKILTGYLKPKNGEVRLGNKILTQYNPKELARKIAYVPQIPASIYPFSVYEIIAMGRYTYLGISGFERERDKEKIFEIASLLELEHILDKGISEISGGETQRAFIARALVQEPQILLLDEPNAHLDIKHQLSIFNLLKKLNDENGITIITVMHDLNLSKYYSSRILMLKEGKVFLNAVPAEAITKENIFSVFDVNVDIQKSKMTEINSIIINPGYVTKV
jgi:iron complex transport system ATP-binding protein